MRLQCDYVGYPKIWQEIKDELQFVNDIVVSKNSVFSLLRLNQGINDAIISIITKGYEDIIYLIIEMIILVLWCTKTPLTTNEVNVKNVKDF